ncbi:uncharacterized protein [Epargyreus clarus]|uniref:uncharacterized protein n=1 Tax=Epargyreus clarus TaxID=520877 RepID=UPI003C2E615E
MELETIIIISAFSGAWLLLLVISIVLCTQISVLRRKINEMQRTGRIRVQKLKMNNDKNHAFHNPALSPDEELSRRGFSMYQVDDDIESGRGTERQTGGQFIEELAREIDRREQKQSTAPPFLLHSIEDNKRISRAFANPVVNHGRASETNPNFIY